MTTVAGMALRTEFKWPTRREHHKSCILLPRLPLSSSTLIHTFTNTAFWSWRILRFPFLCRECVWVWFVQPLVILQRSSPTDHTHGRWIQIFFYSFMLQSTVICFIKCISFHLPFWDQSISLHSLPAEHTMSTLQGPPVNSRGHASLIPRLKHTWVLLEMGWMSVLIFVE